MKEGKFLQELSNRKPAIDFVTGEWIDQPTIYNMHHILTKAAYPSFRCEEKNIVYLSIENHNLVHQRAESDLTNPEKNKNWQGWLKYFALQKDLKQQYYQK